jgi:hypothetical protein
MAFRRLESLRHSFQMRPGEFQSRGMTLKQAEARNSEYSKRVQSPGFSLFLISHFSRRRDFEILLQMRPFMRGFSCIS